MTEANLYAGTSHISLMQRPYGPRFLMDEAGAGGAPAAAAVAPAMPETFSSVSEAARFLTAERNRKDQPAASGGNEQSSDDGAEQAVADDHESSVEDDAALGEGQDHGEDQDGDPADEPPIARPKSWAKEEQAEWDGLPRSLQEKIAAREDARDKAVRKGQNDAAEKLKGLTAKEQAAEQARTTYEQKARDAFAVLAREQQRDFADIKTVEDVTNLAGTDPLRFIQWQAHQQQLAAAKQAVDEADKRKADKEADDWKSYRATENAKAIEHIPDLGDQAKAPKLMEKAVALLQDVGFTAADLGNYDKGEKLSLFDHRFQRVLVDAIRYRDMKAASKAVVAKPVPNVQRPGVRQPSGNANSERIQALTNRFNSTGSLRDAARLLTAERSSKRRAG